MITSINPYTQEQIAKFEEDNSNTIDQKLNAATLAFGDWRRRPFNQRSHLMKTAGAILRAKKEHLAKTITLEMGKTLTESKAEIDKCADVCDFFADNAEHFLADSTISTDASKSFVSYQPLGPVLAVMPWNFPFWQVFRFAAPALMAGNVGLLKHASNVMGCSVEIEKIFIEAGFPKGVFQSLIVSSKQVESIIAHDHVTAVALTGSEAAGVQVAAVAGKHLKKTVLELGGSDPFIVLEDADLSLAARIAVQSRMRNAGQSCIAAKRFIVLNTIKDDFLQAFKLQAEKIVQGDPLLDKTTMGPMARLDLAEGVSLQLQQAIAEGASVITGGDRERCNFQPTIIEVSSDETVAFKEEVFGPVAAVRAVPDEASAVKLANASRYGLGASVWTKDKERGERIALSIESGSVFVNSLMRSDQRLPFGGIKKSGYGRELSKHGIKELMNTKTVYIA